MMEVYEKELNRSRKEAVANERGGSQQRTLLAFLVFLSSQLNGVDVHVLIMKLQDIQQVQYMQTYAVSSHPHAGRGKKSERSIDMRFWHS
jgi:hypothetical protein